MTDIGYMLICALLMSLASYIPRALPLVFMRKKIKSRFIRSFLVYMPYAVLASLTFPAIFYSTGNIWTGLIGTLIAFVLSLFNINLAVIALICVASVFGLSFLF